MDVVRIGFIGLGSLTQSVHMPGISSLPGARLVGASDQNDGLLAGVAEKYKLQVAVDDYRELLKRDDLDVVYINLPTRQHHAATMAALDAGKHVFLDKPFGMNLAESRQMAEKARAAKRYLMIGLNQRFAPRHTHLREAIRAGKLGSPYLVKVGLLLQHGQPKPQHWMSRRADGGGVLMDLGISMVDLSLWLLGFPKIAEIAGTMGRHTIDDRYDVEDTASVFLTTANGVAIHIDVAWNAQGGKHRNWLHADVYGSRGRGRARPRWSDDGPPLTLYRRQDDQLISDVVSIPVVDSHLEQNRHLLDCVRRGIEPETKPEDALHAVGVIDALYQRYPQLPIAAIPPATTGTLPIVR